jgi:hypothetical protein
LRCVWSVRVCVANRAYAAAPGKHLARVAQCTGWMVPHARDATFQSDAVRSKENTPQGLAKSRLRSEAPSKSKSTLEFQRISTSECVFGRAARPIVVAQGGKVWVKESLWLIPWGPRIQHPCEACKRTHERASCARVSQVYTDVLCCVLCAALRCAEWSTLSVRPQHKFDTRDTSQHKSPPRPRPPHALAPPTVAGSTMKKFAWKSTSQVTRAHTSHLSLHA